MNSTTAYGPTVTAAAALAVATEAKFAAFRAYSRASQALQANVPGVTDRDVDGALGLYRERLAEYEAAYVDALAVGEA